MCYVFLFGSRVRALDVLPSHPLLLTNNPSQPYNQRSILFHSYLMSKPGSDSTSGQTSNFGKSSTSPASSQRISSETVGGTAVIGKLAIINKIYTAYDDWFRFLGSNNNSKPKVPGAAGTTENKMKSTVRINQSRNYFLQILMLTFC